MKTLLGAIHDAAVVLAAAVTCKLLRWQGQTALAVSLWAETGRYVEARHAALLREEYARNNR